MQPLTETNDAVRVIGSILLSLDYNRDSELIADLGKAEYEAIWEALEAVKP